MILISEFWVKLNITWCSSCGNKIFKLIGSLINIGSKLRLGWQKGETRASGI